MARTKNALRGHFIGEIDETDPTIEPTVWLELAKSIATVSDDTDESTDDKAYYDGDGTPEEETTSVKGIYTFEGLYDPEDPAQALIAGMKFKTGSARRVWHKVVTSDGKKSFTQIANAGDIICGSGDASDYEEFKVKLSWLRLPDEKDIIAG